MGFVCLFVTMPKIPLYDVLDHTNHTFSESSRSKDIYTDIPKCLIHKYTNTQIQHMTKCQKAPTCGIFLKRGLFKDMKNDIPMCQTRKYKNTNTKYTNTQIQHKTKCQKDPTCGIFFKSRLFKDIKNYISMCQTRI